MTTRRWIRSRRLRGMQWKPLERSLVVKKKIEKEKEIAEMKDAKQELDLTVPPRSFQETLERIRLDNDRSYFLSGRVDRLIYDENCVFADPFVSFEGRDRFVENLSNLGSFITNYSAKMLRYEDSTPDSIVKTRVMVTLELNLPWKPILAWPWGVEYVIDPKTNLITTHKETWGIEPWEVRIQITGELCFLSCSSSSVLEGKKSSQCLS